MKDRCQNKAGHQQSQKDVGGLQDAVDAIATTQTGAQDRPVEDCFIRTVTVTES